MGGKPRVEPEPFDPYGHLPWEERVEDSADLPGGPIITVALTAKFRKLRAVGIKAISFSRVGRSHKERSRPGGTKKLVITCLYIDES